MQLINKAGLYKETGPHMTMMRKIFFLMFFCSLTLFASGAYAVDYVCSDCHTPQHGPCPDCIGCHTSKSIKYPMGPGMTGLLTDSVSCVTCHLAGTTAQAVHAGVPIDIQSACGQCHGGNAGTGATNNGATYMSESYLSMVSENMHLRSNSSPAASMTTSVSLYTVSLTDKSTDDATLPASAVTVKWGDGTSSNGNQGAVLTHTYASAGSFDILYTVKDAGGLYDSTTTSVSVPQKLSITVSLNPALPSDAVFVLKLNGSTKAKGKATDSYTFDKIKPGKTYQVKVARTGYIFDCGGTGSNKVTVAMGFGNQTVSCTWIKQ